MVDQIAAWTEPELCPCGQCATKHTRLMQNGVELGQVAWDSREIFSARTQLQVIGAFLSLEVAKDQVENIAAYQLYTYPTTGNA